jgi:hypothetical protein
VLSGGPLDENICSTEANTQKVGDDLILAPYGIQSL